MAFVNDIRWLWDDNVAPEVRKLRFLIITCESGVIGGSCDLSDEEYSDATEGLAEMLSGITQNLEKFRADLDELHEKEIEQEETKTSKTEVRNTARFAGLYH